MYEKSVAKHSTNRTTDSLLGWREKPLRKQIVIDVQIPCSTRLRLIESIFYTQPRLAEFWFKYRQKKTRAHILSLSTIKIDLQRINNSVIFKRCCCLYVWVFFPSILEHVSKRKNILNKTNDLIKKTDKLCDSKTKTNGLARAPAYIHSIEENIENCYSKGEIIICQQFNIYTDNIWFSGGNK